MNVVHRDTRVCRHAYKQTIEIRLAVPSSGIADRCAQGSPELALCYFKSITDAEVRGWIYLKDVTEIAENQDIIILTSTARTLHLYAETRAEHNAWVTGLAMLCPDAIKILGRETSCYHPR